jgi:hypothetical protein
MTYVKVKNLYKPYETFYRSNVIDGLKKVIYRD